LWFASGLDTSPMWLFLSLTSQECSALGRHAAIFSVEDVCISQLIVTEPEIFLVESEACLFLKI
jgi:hypothetical protein